MWPVGSEKFWRTQRTVFFNFNILHGLWKKKHSSTYKKQETMPWKYSYLENKILKISIFDFPVSQYWQEQILSFSRQNNQ